MSDLPFKIHSSLKNIIGRDLITDDYIAVFELVKNAYDAHAKLVKIYFEKDKIIIWDNGKGMNYNDLVNKWLYVAYSAKREGTEDIELKSELKNYRDKLAQRTYYAGAKGIGRFSCDKLGRYLRLITKKIGHKSKIEQLKVDWERFDTEVNTEFINVKVQHNTLNEITYRNFSQGTILEITELNSSWNRTKILELKKSLEKLINPFESYDDALKFSIEIIAKNELENDRNEDSDREKVNGIVRNFIFETLDVKTTQLITEIKSSSIETKIIDRGELIYDIREHNKYEKLGNLKFHLFYLNKSAKNSFTRLMGLRPVRFGSVFLYKNGIRVYPYGNPGEDFFGIDRRKQQGYARFLGTRDLIGRTELFDFSDEFRETSSRDGGLVETKGFLQLKHAFYETALKRLEKYVVDVQWSAMDKDKYLDDISALDNINSKQKIISVISKLVDSENVELISYNKDFLNIIEDKIEEASPSVFKDLSKIALKTEDRNFDKQIQIAENQYKKIIEEKEKAEKKIIKAEKARKKAEEATKMAEERRLIEKEKRKKAEIDAKEKELKRREEELRRKEAEQKAKEEKEKRKKEEEAREKAEKESKRRKNQVLFLQSVKALEYQDVKDLNHIIGLNSDTINKEILRFKRRIDKGKEFTKKEILDFIKAISLANNKIFTISNFTTKGNFLKAAQDTNQDIIEFIRKYVNMYYSNIFPFSINVINSKAAEFIMNFHPIEITMLLDNLISNSRKSNAKANKINLIFDLISNKSLQIIYRDNGKGLDKSISNVDIIFEEGFTTTNGSGLGLAHVKKIIEEMKGSIKVNPDYKNGFELIIFFNR